MAEHNNARLPMLEGKPVPAKVLFRCHPDLKDLLEQKVDEDGLAGGVNELIVNILARALRRPDLARVPRRKRGPKPKELAAAAK